MEESKQYTNQEKATEESIKLLYDLFKHITTLSTGILLILIAFLEKLFQTPTAKFLVGISFACFTITIIFSLITMAVMIQGIADIGDLEEDEEKFGRWSFLITTGSFLQESFVS